MTWEDHAREREAYVGAALALHGYAADEALRQRVTAQFARIADIAASFLDADLPLDAEPAALFQP
ncbi:AtzG-like protein [Noviherbaspirillum pedocola]|uniref:DUF4089 domain-containing protein n=1 Tax=Noviherbaspirillum pedocola TaxID=2801341 RepID=A0A934W6J7_9BURK|nr:AtzG-like protein [Noviherbaspirillum pedocola]MBK4735190.1 DUF4089 domain-containing protein [Noviherbaspirillum pedocola]